MELSWLQAARVLPEAVFEEGGWRLQLRTSGVVTLTLWQLAVEGH